jgi:hypothetical protein
VRSRSFSILVVEMFVAELATGIINDRHAPVTEGLSMEAQARSALVSNPEGCCRHDEGMEIYRKDA